MNNPLRELVAPPKPATVEDLLSSIGLPADFLSQLMSESDWSMIIKLHAVFEAVLSSLIVRSIGTKEVEEQVAHLDFNNTKSGKVAFARALGLIEKPSVAFLRGLSELRNRLVHDIRNVSFNLKAYAAEMSESERKKFTSEFGHALHRLSDGKRLFEEALRKEPKTIIYVAAYRCLLEMQFQVSGRSRDMLVQALVERAKK